MVLISLQSSLYSPTINKKHSKDSENAVTKNKLFHGAEFNFKLQQIQILLITSKNFRVSDVEQNNKEEIVVRTKIRRKRLVLMLA